MGNLGGRKLSWIPRFCGYSRKFSRENRTFHQFTKVFSLKSFLLYGTRESTLLALNLMSTPAFISSTAATMKFGHILTHGATQTHSDLNAKLGEVDVWCIVDVKEWKRHFFWRGGGVPTYGILLYAMIERILMSTCIYMHGTKGYCRSIHKTERRLVVQGSKMHSLSSRYPSMFTLTSFK